MPSATTLLTRGHPPGTRGRLRLAAGLLFTVVTMVACALAGRRFSHTGWPLEHAPVWLVLCSAVAYFASYVFRALGWQRLFPADSRPGRARCLAACGAAAASGVVLPFRLDYLIKVGTLRRMRGVQLGLEAIVLSIISLGLVDAVAFLPLSISATATSSSEFRWPLAIVVGFGVACCGILVAGQRLLAVGAIARRARVSRLLGRVANHPHRSGRDAVVAWFFLVGCWSTRALGSTCLLAALGVGFSPTTALIVLCLSAAASLIPVASGGAVANVGATAAALLALGVHGGQALNFGLASGLLLCGTAAAAALVGVAASLASAARARLFAPV